MAHEHEWQWLWNGLAQIGLYDDRAVPYAIRACVCGEAEYLRLPLGKTLAQAERESEYAAAQEEKRAKTREYNRRKKAEREAAHGQDIREASEAA